MLFNKLHWRENFLRKAKRKTRKSEKKLGWTGQKVLRLGNIHELRRFFWSFWNFREWMSCQTRKKKTSLVKKNKIIFSQVHKQKKRDNFFKKEQSSPFSSAWTKVFYRRFGHCAKLHELTESVCPRLRILKEKAQRILQLQSICCFFFLYFSLRLTRHPF